MGNINQPEQNTNNPEILPTQDGLMSLSFDTLESKIDSINDEKLKELLGEAYGMGINIVKKLGNPDYKLSKFKADLSEFVDRVPDEFTVEIAKELAPILLNFGIDVRRVDIHNFKEVAEDEIENTTEEDYQKVLSAKKEFVNRKINQQKNYEKTQNFNLDFRQQGALRKVKSVGELASKATSKAEFLRSVKDEVARQFTSWAEMNGKFIDAFVQKTEIAKVNGEMEKQTINGKSAEINGNFGLQNIMGVVGMAKGLFTGNLKGYKQLGENPLLRAVLGPKQSEIQADFIKSFDTSNGLRSSFNYNTYKSIADKAVDDLFANKELSDIRAHFRKLSPRPLNSEMEGLSNIKKKEKIEKAQADAKIVVAKLKTVGKSWRNSDWEKGYKDYVISTGPDAYNFDDWLDSLEGDEAPKMLTRIINYLRDIFGDLMSSFDDKKDKVKKEKENTSDLMNEYLELSGKKPTKKEKDSKTKEDDKQGATEFFAGLNSLLKDGEEVSIMVNGEALTEVTAKQKSYLSAVENFMKNKEPKARLLLTKGLELDDLVFLAKNEKKLKSLYSVNFKSDSLEFTFGDDDLSSKFDYSNFNKGNFHDTVNALRIFIENKTLINSSEIYSDYIEPGVELSLDDKYKEGFNELLEYLMMGDKSLVDGYKLTKEDVEAFKMAIDNEFLDYDWSVNPFHAETDNWYTWDQDVKVVNKNGEISSIDNDEVETFLQVDGTGGISGDLNFKNVKSFFAFLRTKYSSKTPKS